MSKNNGAVFSKRLFGYKRSDVNDYIRNSDQAHTEEIAKINYEKEALSEKLRAAEAKISELEALRAAENAAAESRIKKLTLDFEKKLSEMDSIQSNYKDKLTESETRASSYLKMADSSAVRAESAEAELTILSAALEDSKNEIDALNKKLANKEAEAARISELEALAKKAIECGNNNTAKSGKRSLLKGIFERIGLRR